MQIFASELAMLEQQLVAARRASALLRSAAGDLDIAHPAGPAIRHYLRETDKLVAILEHKRRALRPTVLAI